MEGKHMKKDKSDALIQKLIQNKISREEFYELLDGLNDEQSAMNLEASLKSHFIDIINNYKKEIELNKKSDPNVKSQK